MVADVAAAAVTVVGGALYARGVRRAWTAAGPGRVVRTGEAASFAAGLLAVAVALGPLDARAAASLTAHMAQHVVLLVVAAPLLALGAPLRALVWALPAHPRLRLRPTLRVLERSRARHGPAWIAGAVLVQSAAMWSWHAPGLYDAALDQFGTHSRIIGPWQVQSDYNDISDFRILSEHVEAPILKAAGSAAEYTKQTAYNRAPTTPGARARPRAARS